ncbi:Poly(A)+ RNA export protein-like protein [Bimuria novae-zelandiae CBS 107.79]|uniref:Poly(A)+ RNA export protein-like protein n=1 Tax=Bimuria novae-zelandiae CBS 107.79 TaxID=1447943 RepID=A0A6A5V0C0_9PLEO|nr:Poly(A)+ RNA export protein-like protein [Bimuria novae-zelandiae CBS 107.79]
MALFGTQAPAATSTTGDLSKDVEVQQGMPSDSISDLAFSPTHDFLAMTSWDKYLTIFEVTANGTVGKWRAKTINPQNKEEIPLCLAWSPDGTKIAAGGADGHVFYYDLAVLGTGDIVHSHLWQPHSAGVKGLRWFTFQGKPVLITGSWDKSVKYFDMSTGTPIEMGTLQCQERVYSMDVRNQLLVIATAERHIHIVNLQEPSKIHKTISSPLKWQTRVVSCFSDASGFAVGSIEGRCAIQYVDDSNTSLNFSFKCHRQQDPANRDIARVYSVNAISFHPQHGTFSTAGSDGTFHFWDKDAKHRLKGYPDVGGSITATAFNKDGNIFAYAISYDWSKGYAASTPAQKLQVKLHPIMGDECKPRPGSKKR